MAFLLRKGGTALGAAALLLAGVSACSSSPTAPSTSNAAFVVDLGARAATTPKLVQPGALPGAVELVGVSNTETDREGHTYTWQAIQDLVINLELAGRPRAHELRMRAQPFPLGDGTVQTVTPMVNGTALTTQNVVTHREELLWTVPTSLIKKGTNELILHAGYATAPADVKPSAKDQRTLAYRIYGMSMSPVGRQGPAGATVELVQASPVVLPIEGADGLKLQISNATLIGDPPLTLTATLSVDGPATLPSAYRQIKTLELGADALKDIALPIPLALGESAMLHIEVHGASGTSALLSELRLTGGRPDPGVATTNSGGPPPRLIILYVSDTTRSDRMSVFGYPRNTTPRMQELVDAGADAWVAHSNSSWTRPSIATMLTGLEQGAHGIGTKWDSLATDLPVLAEQLRDAGYRTVAFSGSSHVQEGSGFARGFDRFEDVSEPRSMDDLKPRIEHYVADILKEIDLTDGAPLFVFVHSIGPHDPYQPPMSAQTALNLPPIPTVYGEDLAAGDAQLKWVELAFRDRIPMDGAIVGGLSELFDAEIYAEDAQFGAFVDALQQRGLWKDTLMVFASDHGEEFGDHGNLRHGRTLFDEQLEVPLVVHWPFGWTPTKATTAGLLDIAPTIAAVAGASPIPRAQGRDLTTDPPAPPYWHAEVDAEKLYALWDDRFKLVRRLGRDASVQLYDRQQDPDELVDIHASHPARLQLMSEALEARHEENTRLRKGHGSAAAGLTETQEARLRVLGYLDDHQ